MKVKVRGVSNQKIARTREHPARKPRENIMREILARTVARNRCETPLREKGARKGHSLLGFHLLLGFDWIDVLGLLGLSGLLGLLGIARILTIVRVTYVVRIDFARSYC